MHPLLKDVINEILKHLILLSGELKQLLVMLLCRYSRSGHSVTVPGKTGCSTALSQSYGVCYRKGFPQCENYGVSY